MNAILRYTLDTLVIMLYPPHWGRNFTFDPVWDKELNSLLDSGAKIHRPRYREIMVGETRVWISNYPYAYGTKIQSGTICTRASRMPSRRTVLRLRRLITAKYGVI